MWKFKFRSQKLEKIEKFFIKFLISVLFLVIAFSYAGDSDFELSVKGVSVGIEDLQVYCIYCNRIFYQHELLETRNCHVLSCCILMVSFHPIQLRGSLRVILRPLIPAAPLVGGVSVFFLNRPVS